MRRLSDRINDLPVRYGRYKDLLNAITTAHRCTTKTDLKKICRLYIRTYEERLEQTPKVYKRLREQTKECKKIMHNCLHKAVPRL